VLNREICEWCIGKDVEGRGHGLFKVPSKCLPGTTKEHNKNYQPSGTRF
jgi:hypothetical protein